MLGKARKMDYKRAQENFWGWWICSVTWLQLWLHTYVKTHQIVQLKYVLFNLCQLHLNKQWGLVGGLQVIGRHDIEGNCGTPVSFTLSLYGHEVSSFVHHMLLAMKCCLTVVPKAAGPISHGWEW
jgi:hypothetical protein